MEETNDTIELDVKELFFVLWKKKFWLLLAGIVLAVLAYAGTKMFITPKYESTTKIYVQNREKDGESNTSYSDYQISDKLVQDYAGMISTRTVAEGVIEKLALKDISVGKINSMIKVGTSTTNRIISITITDTDPNRARDIADCVRDISGENIAAITGASVKVVDPANLPQYPSSPNAKRNALLGGVAGIILLAAFFLIRFLMDDTIKTAEDVERYLELSVLGTIPLAEGQEKTKKKAKKGGKR